ncbi:MAG: hypothetical protein U1E27_11010, partial [Kiritimatiellia bacterium]|nr:hypothetical protein [Kiritimatiellia bacterium]
MKRILAVLLCAGGLVRSAPAGELIARWTFDTRENRTAPEATGRHPGTIRGDVDALQILPGMDGQAYLFNEGLNHVEV